MLVMHGLQRLATNRKGILFPGFIFKIAGRLQLQYRVQRVSQCCNLIPGFDLVPECCGSRFEYSARGEADLRLLQKGQIIQIERRGYYICDRPYVRASEPVELIFVPDGKKMMGIETGSVATIKAV